MKSLGLIVAFLLIFPILVVGQDYFAYHATVRKAENCLLDQDWSAALKQYLVLEKDFDFLFSTDLKIAMQLAFRVDDSVSFQRFSNKFFSRGGKWKKVKKELKRNPDFHAGLDKKLKTQSKSTKSEGFPNPEIRKDVERLFVQDQWQALGALFTFSSENQDRYAERKFAPKAKERVAEIREIMDDIGYPGEMLIGNSIWSATILSHYNSISEKFVKADTLYLSLRESLRTELGQGRISPFEFALVDNWYQSVSSGRMIESYGILEGEVREDSIQKVDRNRLAVGLPTVENYNKLLELQEKTGIRLFFGHAWGNNSPIVVKK